MTELQLKSFGVNISELETLCHSNLHLEINLLYQTIRFDFSRVIRSYTP